MPLPSPASHPSATFITGVGLLTRGGVLLPYSYIGDPTNPVLFGGLIDVDPYIWYWAITMDALSDRQAMLSFVTQVRDYLAGLVQSGVATTQQAQAAITNELVGLQVDLDTRLQQVQGTLATIEDLIARIPPGGGGDTLPVLAAIADAKASNSLLFAQLNAYLPEAFGQLASEEQQHFAQLWDGLLTLEAEITAVPAETKALVDAVVTDRLNPAVERILAAIAGGLGIDPNVIQSIADYLLRLDNDVETLVINNTAAIAQATDRVATAVRQQVGDRMGGLQGLLALVAASIQAIAPADVAEPIEGLGTKWGDVLDKNRASLTDALQGYGLTREQLDASIEGAAMPSARGLVGLIGALGTWFYIGNNILAEKTGVDLLAKAAEEFPFIGETAKAFATGAGHTLMSVLTAIHAPMREVMKGGASLVFTELENELDSLGRASPATAHAAAARFLSLAGAFGMSSHLAAVAGEKVFRSKHLGIGQLAAFLADMSQFGAVARDSIGQQLDAAVRIPSRRGALDRFRPELPDERSFEEMYYARELAVEEFDQFYAEHGWSEEWIEPWRLAIWRKLSPRQLAQVFADGEIDLTWALQMIQRSGFNDDDSARIVKGVLATAEKTPRNALVTAVIANYVEGVMTLEDLAAFLRNIPLDEDSVQLHVEQATHRRFQAEAHARRVELESAGAVGAIDLATIDAELAAMGYDAGARALSGERVRVKQGIATFKKEDARITAALRKEQTLSIEAALEGFAKGVYTQEQLDALLLSSGVDQAGATAYVQLAAFKALPTPRKPEVLTAEAQAQEEQRLFTRQVQAFVEKGQMTRSDALSALTSAGLPPRQAALEVGIALARIAPRAKAPGVPGLTPDQLAIQSEQRDAFIAEFRAGRWTAAQLTAALVGAGIVRRVADAIVLRELALRDQLNVRTAQATKSRELAEINRALKAEAIAEYRADDIDEGGLLQGLLAAGEPFDAAQALVDREVALREKQQAKAKTTSGAA